MNYALLGGLEKQATETVKCGLNGTSTAEVFNRKKFAELVVKECALELDDGSKDGLWVKEVLYKHFGIDE